MTSTYPMIHTFNERYYQHPETCANYNISSNHNQVSNLPWIKGFFIIVIYHTQFGRNIKFNLIWQEFHLIIKKIDSSLRLKTFVYLNKFYIYYKFTTQNQTILFVLVNKIGMTF